jgi:hypothetical protein
MADPMTAQTALLAEAALFPQRALPFAEPHDDRARAWAAFARRYRSLDGTHYELVDEAAALQRIADRMAAIADGRDFQPQPLTPADIAVDLAGVRNHLDRLIAALRAEDRP